MLNELTYNVGVFSAFKNHSQIRETVKLLIDADGNTRKKADFIAEAKKLDADYNSRYLTAEYNSATASARMASKWQGIERTRSLYPNIMYIAVVDDRTRELHKNWHRLILPIDHPFWDTHYPPNDWGCRCSIRRTDKPVDDRGLNVDDMPNLPKQFNTNVGKTGKVFNSDHPYFRIREFKRVALEARKALINFQQKELKDYAKTALSGSYKIDSIAEPVHYSSAGVGKLIDRNKRSADWYQTVNLLYDIKNFVADVTFAFFDAGEAQKEGVLGRYLGYKEFDGETYEICFRKTLARTSFYYIRKVK